MKAKTITCHNVYNAGASLQAYALCRYLNDAGVQTQIIDYRPEYLRHYRLWTVSNPAYDRPVLRTVYCLLKLPGRLRAYFCDRKKEFDRFTKNYLPLTDSTYTSFEQLADAGLEADVFFAGSDQIWNTLFRNGTDESFYLAFAPENSVRASYAASFGTGRIYGGRERKIKQWLDGLDFISVREKSGVGLLSSLGIYNAETVLDPVFLLEREHWQQLCEGKSFGDEKYLFVYDFDGSERARRLALTLARQNGLKIYSFLPCCYADRVFENEGPQGFLALINNASLVLSNSFHATAFSLIFEKQFYVIKRQEDINERMLDLLALTGLSDRLCGSSAKPGDIDFEPVRLRLEREREKSKSFISRVLGSA